MLVIFCDLIVAVALSFASQFTASVWHCRRLRHRVATVTHGHLLWPGGDFKAKDMFKKRRVLLLLPWIAYQGNGYKMPDQVPVNVNRPTWRLLVDEHQGRSHAIQQCWLIFGSFLLQKHCAKKSSWTCRCESNRECWKTWCWVAKRTATSATSYFAQVLSRRCN